ncbi:ciliary-associated calcium-binding coiled-coil protein 1-like isoform X2 [Amphiura filiformis]|uniref:ciliary-associated calcium-binding coiled-coil protein 1-like isoform X2 n=1 Tax=Amphiura filiformis TaxID=82378 RepID=UPI003B21795F
MADRRAQLSRRSSSINISKSPAAASPASSNPGSRRSSIASLPTAQQRLQVPAPKFLRRKDEEARNLEKKNSLAWKVLSNTQTQALQDLTVEELEIKLAEIMELPRPDIELSQASLLDYYVSGFWWAKEQGFNVQQLSGFFTLLHTLLENIKEHKMPLADNLTEYKKLLAGVGTEDNEVNGGLDFFDIKQAKLITDFLQMTLFQHHKMYEFLFHHERKEEIVGVELVVETLPAADVPHPPPLEEGLEEAIYLRHLATPPSSPTPDMDGNEEEKKGETEGEGVTRAEDEEKASGDPVDLLAEVTAEDVKTVFSQVSKELFAGLQTDVQRKLKERESEIISRINKIHRIADT